VAAAIAVLGYGLLREKHWVRSLAEDRTEGLSGPAFAAGATYDGYLRRDGQLYDVYSLQPRVAQEKDCKT
jgi:hypothetical protein